jgi:hypothetical protein
MARLGAVGAPRSAAATGPIRQLVAIEARELRSGRTLGGRGVLAVAPGEALRLVLLGPGGVTALDVWMDAHRYRIAIPAIDRVFRGARGEGGEGGAGAREGGAALGAMSLLWWTLVERDGGEHVWSTHARAEHGRLIADATATARFSKEHGLFLTEVERAARDGDERELWLRSGGRWLGYVDADETRLASGARWPLRARIRQIDPPVELTVEGERPELLEAGALPPEAFAEPSP